MNILVAVNEAYLSPLEVMLYSLYKHNRVQLSIYILHFAIPKSRQIQFRDRMCRWNPEIQCIFLQCSEEMFEGLVCGKRYRNEANLRLFLISKLPRDVERILWLDADILIQGGVKRFYHFPDKGQYAVVCQDMASGNTIRELSHQLGLKGRTRYFNSGVILFYLNNMRCDLDGSVFLEWMHSHPDKLRYPDQNALNVILQEKLIWAKPNKYNLQLLNISDRKWMKKAVVLHYNTNEKPWHTAYVGPGEWTYWKYAIRAWGFKTFFRHWLEKCRYMIRGGDKV